MSIKDLEASQHPLEVQQLRARMIQIEEGLLKDTPGIVDAMVDIHKNLLQHEELVQFLDDNDIHNLHLAHEKYKQVVLVQKNIKQQKKVDKNLKNIKVADL